MSSKKMETTGFTSFLEDADEILSGNEKYPIIGDLITDEAAIRVFRSLRGCMYYWDCLRKAKTARTFIPFNTQLVIGGLMVTSGDYRSAYGYYFNPPYEFHAWLECRGGIIDFALPGVIEKGLLTCDKDGPYLVDRSPSILAGKPQSWMSYTKAKEIEKW